MLRPLFILLAVSLLLGACGAPTSETRLSLTGLDCGDCGDEAGSVLAKQAGIEDVEFDRDLAELVVEYDPAKTSPDVMIEALAAADHTAVVGRGLGQYQVVAFPEDADVLWISEAGEKVRLEAHLAASGVTVIDFYADWCGPCKDLDRALAHMMGKRADIAVRKVNIVDWDSDAARQHLAEVSSLPYTVVFAANGTRIADIAGLRIDALKEAIDEAAEMTP